MSNVVLVGDKLIGTYGPSNYGYYVVAGQGDGELFYVVQSAKEAERIITDQASGENESTNPPATQYPSYLPSHQDEIWPPKLLIPLLVERALRIPETILPKQAKK